MVLAPWEWEVWAPVTPLGKAKVTLPCLWVEVLFTERGKVCCGPNLTTVSHDSIAGGMSSMSSMSSSMSSMSSGKGMMGGSSFPVYITGKGTFVLHQLVRGAYKLSGKVV